MTNQTHFTPTHFMTGIGQPNLPCVIVFKRNELWLVETAYGKQYWVGKYNVEEI